MRRLYTLLKKPRPRYPYSREAKERADDMIDTIGEKAIRALPTNDPDQVIRDLRRLTRELTQPSSAAD